MDDDRKLELLKNAVVDGIIEAEVDISKVKQALEGPDKATLEQAMMLLVEGRRLVNRVIARISEDQKYGPTAIH